MSFLKLSRPVRPKLILLLLAISILYLAGSCTVQENLVEQSPATVPIYLDDDSTGSLLAAIDHHLSYLERLDPKAQMEIGNLSYSAEMLLGSLKFFRSIVVRNPDPLTLGQAIRKHFHVFGAIGRTGDGELLVTGYYEPLFAGSVEKKEPFVHPLYSLPDTLVTRQQGETPRLGRVDETGAIVPFWNRRQIETDGLLDGFELVYLKDPLDAYLLHVQGSGRVQLPDGSIRAIRYAGNNGLEYRSLGKLFVDREILEKQEVNIPAIRDFFKAEPQKMIPMLHENPRYIFFKWGDDRGPIGSLGTILTPGRSIAIDNSALPAGALGYLVSSKPVLNPDGSIDHWRPFGRFVLPQDSGSAIKGPGRVDLFWGNDRYAEIAASHMNHPGELFFLVKKNFELEEKSGNIKH